MYGMVNQAVKGLIVQEVGESAWASIVQNTGAPSSFEDMLVYDDKITYDIVAEISRQLEVSAEDLLIKFGAYWIENIALKNYQDLLDKKKHNIYTFLQNLNAMHDHLKITYPKLMPPIIRSKELDNKDIQIDYYSKRVGLESFVIGLLQGLMEHFEVSGEISFDNNSNDLPGKRFFIRKK